MTEDRESILYDLTRELLLIREPVKLVSAIDQAAQKLGLPVTLGFAADSKGRSLVPLSEYHSAMERFVIMLEGTLHESFSLNKPLSLGGDNPLKPLLEGRIITSHERLAPVGGVVLGEKEFIEGLVPCRSGFSREQSEAIIKTLGITGICALPLGGRRLVGVLLLTTTLERPDWEEGQKELLSRLAGLVDPVLDSLADQESLKALAREGQAWFEIARIMALPRLSLDRKLKISMGAILDLHHVETGSIMIRQGRYLVVRAASNKKILGFRQHIDTNSISAHVARTGMSLNLGHVSGDSRFSTSPGDRSIYRCDMALAVPISFGRKILGVLSLTNRAGGGPFDPAEERRIVGFVGRIGGFIDRALVNEVLIKERARLRKTNETLKRLEKTKQDLTNMVVHDLKGPLAEVVANIHLLSDESLSELGREALESALLGTDALSLLIANLLHISRMEEDRFDLKLSHVSVYTVIQTTLNRLKTLLDQHGHEVVLAIEPDLPRVEADEEVLSRIIQNLVVNAVDHTPMNGRLTFRGFLGKGLVTVSLADQGPGVDPAYREVIFEKFSRNPDRKGPSLSTGLGLNFCKLAVEAHGGRIWVQEAPGVGADFRFTLPLAEEK